MNGWRTLLPNAWYIAVREYRSRVRTRSFVIGTIVLAVIAFASTQLPVLIDFSMSTTQTRLAVATPAQGMPPTSEQLMRQVLNGQDATLNGGHESFAISWWPGVDPAVVQTDLEAGRYDALLIVKIDPTSKDLAFVLRTDMPADGRAVQMIGTAAASLEIEDRLFQKGTSTAALRAGYEYAIQPVKENSAGAKSLSQEVSKSVLSTGLIILIFMAIITYGVWVAMSVAEEKSSRVMELMLNATTPLQMLAGKVVGNGAAGLTQYGVVMGAVVGGLLAQGPIHKVVVGTDSSVAFGGLSPLVLGAFVVLFVLGFALYSLLYAALGSLVSRQEDVQSATSPLMTLVLVGYFASLFASESIDDTWVRVASFVPFFSPYLMLTRVSVGHVEPWEFALAVLLLLAGIAVALFIAARIYSAGVLLYGQRVGLRQVLKATRVSR
jgi:ABC-2 type transport system permease protein